MKKEYDEMMNKIKVTNEMQKRILNRIEEIDFKDNRKNVNFSKYLSVAACFLFLLIGIKVIPHIQNEESNSLIQDTSEITEYSSVDEVSEVVGFKVEDIKNLPFDIKTSTYTLYDNRMVSITYSNDTESAVFRKSKGHEDNSGDYNRYENVIEVEMNQLSVILKGNEAGYNLAIWTNGDYSYSLFISMDLSEIKWSNIILGIE